MLNNFALIVAGTLVGASGTVLTKLMSDAMGRSVTNVLFGAVGQMQRGTAGVGTVAKGRAARAGTADDIGMLLAYSRYVIIVPGYGLAVARRSMLRELATCSSSAGCRWHTRSTRWPGGCRDT